MRRVGIRIFAFFAAVVFVPSTSAAQDYDAMAKWTDAKVIRYHVSGDFTGSTAIMGGKANSRMAKVTDHVEFDFDWDNVEMKLIGTPVIKNFPSKLGAIGEPPLELYGKCPAVKLEGPYEHWTLQSVTTVSTMLMLSAKRDMAAGSIPYSTGTNLPCGSSWDAALATSSTVTARLSFPLAAMLEMGRNMTETEVTKDKKSFVVKPSDQPGWVWTMTPTIVK